MDCSTILVSYNTYTLTVEAVSSALAAAASLSHEVIVVDNASPDRSADRLREAFAQDSRVHVIANEENRGFSAANNQGAARASGRNLFFLNPDTIVHGDAIHTLSLFLDAHPEVGAIGPLVLNPDGSHQVSTSNMDSYASILARSFPLRPRQPERSATPRQVDIINGCALALRRRSFDAVGGWDERYFMYAEENELCMALLRNELVNVQVPSAVITHYGGQSSTDRYVEQQLLASQSYVAFLKRHHSRGILWFNRAAAVVGYGGREVIFALLERLRPGASADYRRRKAAAAAIWRFYARGAS